MTKYAGRGLVLSMAGDPIGQATAIGKAGSTRALIDASAYGDDWKSYVLGQQDGDDMAVTLALDPIDEDHAALKTAYDAATVETFELAHAESGFSVHFPAIITAFSRGGDIGGLLEATMSLKIQDPGVQEGS